MLSLQQSALSLELNGLLNKHLLRAQYLAEPVTVGDRFKTNVAWVVHQFEITPKAFANFSPRVASTLGKQNPQRRTLKEFAGHLANAFSVR
jgi:hypothetical protein